jgi:hypothetical protein
LSQLGRDLLPATVSRSLVLLPAFPLDPAHSGRHLRSIPHHWPPSGRIPEATVFGTVPALVTQAGGVLLRRCRRVAGHRGGVSETTFDEVMGCVRARSGGDREDLVISRDAGASPAVRRFALVCRGGRTVAAVHRQRTFAFAPTRGSSRTVDAIERKTALEVPVSEVLSLPTPPRPARARELRPAEVGAMPRG